MLFFEEVVSGCKKVHGAICLFWGFPSVYGVKAGFFCLFTTHQVLISCLLIEGAYPSRTSFWEAVIFYIFTPTPSKDLDILSFLSREKAARQHWVFPGENTGETRDAATSKIQGYGDREREKRNIKVF